MLERNHPPGRGPQSPTPPVANLPSRQTLVCHFARLSFYCSYRVFEKSLFWMVLFYSTFREMRKWAGVTGEVLHNQLTSEASPSAERMSAGFAREELGRCGIFWNTTASPRMNLIPIPNGQITPLGFVRVKRFTEHVSDLLSPFLQRCGLAHFLHGTKGALEILSVNRAIQHALPGQLVHNAWS